MQQSQSTPDQAQVLADLEAKVARLERIIQLKDEQIRLLNFRLFGPKSEKLSSAQVQLLLEEASVTAGEVAHEAELPEAQKHPPLPRAKQPRPNHPGRERLPEHLERREEILPCCPEDCQCAKCGAERPVIGYDRVRTMARGEWVIGQSPLCPQLGRLHINHSSK